MWGEAGAPNRRSARVTVTRARAGGGGPCGPATHPEAVHSSGAAHEADEGAVHAAREANLLNDVAVEAGAQEARRRDLGGQGQSK